ncbi:pyridoxal-phosphate dependent enzyme [Actinoplanes sp. NPDC051475]|uniref:pyridoxal-phosphate dependent enzyme n=1 Tax=Actinoplanes sp. NPDC051475 TaxID=3157225 RepID=UPI00344B48E8
MNGPDGFVARLRARDRLVGYWIACDNPLGTERVAGVGYDYIGVDGQHGVTDSAGWRSAMLAVDAMRRSAGVIRVATGDPATIGVALDAGARAVIVPMVETAEQAELAVRACRHWPRGTRSLGGPVRAELRLGSVPAEIDEGVACIVMIETAAALANLAAICATPGLDAVYVGPADLTVALGGAYFGDPEAADALAQALKEITTAAELAGIACGMHCPDGDTAAQRLAEGFTFATVSSDITHLEQVAANHLRAARGIPAVPTGTRPPAESLEDLAGGTPALRVRLAGLPARVRLVAKLETFNPLLNVKDRAVAAMIRAAEDAGRLGPDTTVIECSSGSTGISLAAFCARRDLRCIILMPDNATSERRQILRELGAEIVLVPHEEGLPAAWRRAEELHRSMPGSWLAHQDENPANVRAHYETTGPELWQACGGGIDVFVCGVGTGGTLTGVARYLKERRDVHVVAVEPAGSAVLSGGEAGPHGIPGIGAGYVSAITDLSLIDEVVAVPDEAALDARRELARSNGLLVGVSSGAAAHACRVVARQPRWSAATIATIFPDTGERYLSLAAE